MPGVGAWTCNPSIGEDKDGRVPGVHWPLSSLTGERQANERPRTKRGLLGPEMTPDLQPHTHTHLTPPHTHLHTHKLKTTKTIDLKRCHNRLCFRSGLESQAASTAPPCKPHAEKKTLTIPQLKMSTCLVSCPTLMKFSGRYAAEAWNRWVFMMVYLVFLSAGHG